MSLEEIHLDHSNLQLENRLTRQADKF